MTAEGGLDDRCLLGSRRRSTHRFISTYQQTEARSLPAPPADQQAIVTTRLHTPPRGVYGYAYRMRSFSERSAVGGKLLARAGPFPPFEGNAWGSEFNSDTCCCTRRCTSTSICGSFHQSGCDRACTSSRLSRNKKLTHFFGWETWGVVRLERKHASRNTPC